MHPFKGGFTAKRLILNFKINAITNFNFIDGSSLKTSFIFVATDCIDYNLRLCLSDNLMFTV